jgi:Protein of unknown function (DUF2934)
MTGTTTAKPTESRSRCFDWWEKNGKPEGKEDEFWHLAEQEPMNEDEGSPLRPRHPLASLLQSPALSFYFV